MSSHDKKILSINDKCFDGVYDSNVYLNCICSSEDRIGKISSTFEVKNYSDYRWHNRFSNIQFEQEHDKLHIHGHGYGNEQVSGCIYRPLNEVDELCLKLHDPHYTTVSLKICIVLGEEIAFESCAADKKQDWIIEFSYDTFQGTSVKEHGDKKDCDHFLWHAFPLYLKACVNGETLQLMASPDGVQYYLCAKTCLQRQNPLFVGVFLTQNENQWMNWMMLNRIQLVYDTARCKLDYFYRLEKNEKNNLVNQFIDYLYYDIDAITEYSDIHDFIRINIDLDRYSGITVCNKQTGTSESILIYGYDNSQRAYYVVRQDNHRNWTADRLPYDSMILSRGDITLWEYRPHAIFYSFRPDAFKKALSDYLYSHRSDSQLLLIMPQKESYQFGISVYQYVLSGDLQENIENLMLLKEHAMHWSDLLRFLKLKNIAIPDELLHDADITGRRYSDIDFSRLNDSRYQKELKAELSRSIDLEKKMVANLIEIL